MRLTETAYLQEVRAATRRKGHIKGWADSQPLAVRVVQGNDTVLRFGPAAKIVPHDDLENLRERDFRARPAGRRLHLHRHGVPQAAHSRAAERPLGFVSDTQPVVREPHRNSELRDIPGSARRVFIPQDEVLWVACGMGCCTGGRQAAAQ